MKKNSSKNKASKGEQQILKKLTDGCQISTVKKLEYKMDFGCTEILFKIGLN